MKKKLTKIVVDENRHTYVLQGQAKSLYGSFSRTVMPLDNGRWCVESRDGARFSGRCEFESARSALESAKQGGTTSVVMVDNRGWHRDMANTLYHASTGAAEALQSYIDKCFRHGARANLDRYINMAQGENVMEVVK
jgi:hypothetical protein